MYQLVRRTVLRSHILRCLHRVAYGKSATRLVNCFVLFVTVLLLSRMVRQAVLTASYEHQVRLSLASVSSLS